MRKLAVVILVAAAALTFVAAARADFWLSQARAEQLASQKAKAWTYCHPQNGKKQRYPKRVFYHRWVCDGPKSRWLVVGVTDKRPTVTRIG